MRSSLGNTPKLLKSILYSLIDRTFFATFTWSGKASKGQTKNSLRKYPKFVDFLYAVVTKFDEKYQYSLFLEHLKNKIIKYAYE